MTTRKLRVRGVGLALAALAIAGASRLGATSPTPPWRLLEQRAASEGAAAVRREYRRRTDEILARLAATPEAATLEGALERSLDRAWLYEFLRSWARAEARDVRAGKSNPSLAQALSMPLVECLEAGHATATRDADELDRRRAEAAPETLARLGLTVSPAGSFENDRLQAVRSVALLAKVGKNEAALGRVFALSGGRIDSCTTPEEFVAFPHDWSELLGTATPAAGGGR